ncbi:MAG: hypothetical protein COA43_16355 [Robiginitomaculum sp.]|nr:MAG: hypothetical protein COA43_16355 [Robiginitomaculum sp.]
MMFTKQILIGMSLTALGLVGCTSTTGAYGTQESMSAAQTVNADEMFDITKLTCWELSTLPEADAGYAAILVYGYRAGQSVQNEQSATRIEGAIANVMETCATHPNMMAIQAFK